jgi:protein tyrosine phosphatase (PTP) superfamily phosphohydrolase (DUF442 family)
MTLLSGRIATAALLLWFSVTPAVAQTGAAAPAGVLAVNLSRVRIDNFGQVDQHYFRGAQPKGHDYADLAAAGVKTLINLTSDDADATERSMAASAGLKYFQIAMTTHQPPTTAQITQFLQVVTDPANQPVYVHCVGGRHRTGVMTAVYRMVNGWTADRAFQEMKHYKFGADFLHPEFKTFVYAYRPDGAQLAARANANATSAAPARAGS